jgi:phosphatidate cytidylyltransferase
LRAIWGALAAALLVSCTFGGPISFGLFFAAVQAVMLKEFYRIMRASGYRPASWTGGIMGVAIFGAISFVVGYTVYAKIFHWPMGFPTYSPLAAQSNSSHLVALLASVPIWIAGAILLLVTLTIREIVLWPTHGQPFANIGATLVGLFYISLPMAMLSVIAFGAGHFEPGRVFCLIFFVFRGQKLWQTQAGT